MCTKKSCWAYQLVFLHFTSSIIQETWSASPKKDLCQETYQIAFRENSPYVERLDFNYSGLLPDIFKLALSECCRGTFRLNFSVELRSQEDMMDLNANYSVDFVMPVTSEVASKKMLYFPFVSVVESPGIAFYTTQSQSLSEAILLAIESAAPLIIIMSLLVAISGTIFWILETTFLVLEHEESLPFPTGVWEGVWWAFVSMTTVGYGDVFPKTKPGKVFSIFWVLTGVAFCALFTSFITTILTSACLSDRVTLYGEKVGVIRGTAEHKFALQKNAIPVVHESVSEFPASILSGAITGALIDSYVASEHQSVLSEFRLQSIIEHVTSNGIVFQNIPDQEMPKCIRDYILSRQEQVYRVISRRIKPIKISGLSSAEQNSQQIFDPKNPGFYVPVFSGLIILVVLFIIGCLWEWRRERQLKLQRKENGEEEEQEKDALIKADLSVSQWRTSYKFDFNGMVREIKKDADLIQTKCLVILNKLNIPHTQHLNIHDDCAYSFDLQEPFNPVK